MNWLVLIIISLTLNSIVSLLQRVMLKKDASDPVAYSVFFQLSISLLFLIFGLLINDIVFHELWNLIPNLLLMTVLYGLGNALIFTALKSTEASKFTIIFASRALFSVVGYSLILGDVFTTKQIFGLVMLLLAMLLVNRGNFSWKVKKGDILSLLAGLCFGLANINDKILLGQIPIYTYLFLAFFTPPLFILLIRPATVSKLRSVLNKETLKVMLATIVLYGLGSVTFFTSLKNADSPSKVSTVNLAGVVLTVVFAIILLKERDKIPQKLIAAIMTVAGMYLIV